MKAEKHAIKSKQTGLKTAGLDFEPVFLPYIAKESLKNFESKMKV